jgi:hypothetical protein
MSSSEKKARPTHLKLVSSRERPATFPDYVLPLMPESWVPDWEEEDWVEEEASSLITRSPDGHSYRHRVFHLFKSFCILLFGKTAQRGKYRW